LSVEVCRTALLVHEVAVDTRLIDAIKLTLEAVQIGFAQRPGLGEVHLLEVVAKFDKFVVCVLESVVDLALPAQIVSRSRYWAVESTYFS
jgi:hypothetical protein